MQNHYEQNVKDKRKYIPGCHLVRWIEGDTVHLCIAGSQDQASEISTGHLMQLLRKYSIIFLCYFLKVNSDSDSDSRDVDSMKLRELQLNVTTRLFIM